MLNPEQFRIRRVNRLHTRHGVGYRHHREHALREANWGSHWIAAPTLFTRHYDWSDSRNMRSMSDAWNRVPANVEFIPAELADIVGECLSCIMEAITYTDADTGEYQPKTKGLPTGFQIRFIA